jgi:murein DD-endopeptidase MepM/ murein hydrolase activator NlpD
MRRISIIIILLFFLCDALAARDIPALLSLDDRTTDSLRHDIRAEESVLKAKGPELGLPSLSIFSYTVQKGDTIWNIASRTGQNLDTLISLNNLGTPDDVRPGMTLYIPNLRGIIVAAAGETETTLEAKYGVPFRYIVKINGGNALSKEYMFIPGGGITSLQRSLFLGIGWAAPLRVMRKTSGFGERTDPFTGKQSFHTGVDLGCPVNTPVYAARDGVVRFAGYDGDFGNLVIIAHAHGYCSYYGHLSRILVKPGKRVTIKSCLALSGNTGRTTGPHLHFEIRKESTPINPVIVLR